MRIVNPNAVLLDNNTMTPYQMIEIAGRTCYKSESNITPDSAVKFVQNMLKNGHTAMLEHAHIYLRISSKKAQQIMSTINEYRTSVRNDNTTMYLNITDRYSSCYISGSFRTFINLFKMYFDTGIHFDDKVVKRSEGMDALYKTLSEQYSELFPTKNLSVETDEKIYIFSNAEDFAADVYDMVYEPSLRDNILKKHIVHSIVFTCDRGISHEFVRHRPCGFAQESTRYCNYRKDKFGSEIAVIKPLFFEYDSVQWWTWLRGCENAEKTYFELLDLGASPQEARSVLPNSLKTELVITATENEWQHIVNLRYLGTTGKPHPQMVEVMTIAAPILASISDNRIDINK